jgi:ribosome recycling factor
LLENVVVEVYGSKMPINQVASVAVAEPRLLTVQVWDANNTKAVEKAIANASLGLNPQPSGTLIRVPLPGLTEERRVELSKVAAKYAEQARIAVRNIRREAKKNEDRIQKLTDDWIKKIDESLNHKEQEIKQV